MKLKNKKLNINKLAEFGFLKSENGYVYNCNMPNTGLVMHVVVKTDGEMETKVFDENGEEYVLHLVETATGAYVGTVRNFYNRIVDSIVCNCYDADIYKESQSIAVIEYIFDKYGGVPDFPWDDENFVVRRADTGKWYAVFLKVSSRKIGYDSDDIIEILNIKVPPDDVERIVDCKRYFPAYHMNKKHWVTIHLGGKLDTDEICNRIDLSYELISQK